MSSSTTYTDSSSSSTHSNTFTASSTSALASASASIQGTTIVTAGGGITQSTVQMIAGVSLVALFLMTMPIVVWLVLRYRRQPIKLFNSDTNSDNRPTLSDPESASNSSTLDLLEPKTPVSDSIENNISASNEETCQVWAIIDGQKRQITIPRYLLRPSPPSDSQGQFVDSVVPEHHQSLPRIAVSHSAQSNHSAPPSSTTSANAPPPRGSTTASHAPPSPRPSAETQAELISSATRLIEKAYRPRRQRPAQEARPLSSEDIAARIIVPERAADVRPFRRNHVEYNENSILPPNYSQATQLVSSSQRLPQVHPRAR